MGYIEEIQAYLPQNRQEEKDQNLILSFIQKNKNVLTRHCEIAHVTSSGFVVNPSRNKVLMVHHRILGCWAWTGGHADGNPNLLEVALQEAEEETGAPGIQPLCPEIASLDILPVPGHIKNGDYVSTHLHLSVAYLLVCEESVPLRCKPDENTGVQWVPETQILSPGFSPADVYLYGKLLQRAQSLPKK